MICSVKVEENRKLLNTQRVEIVDGMISLPPMLVVLTSFVDIFHISNVKVGSTFPPLAVLSADESQKGRKRVPQ